jgi:hypothetical protein
VRERIEREEERIKKETGIKKKKGKVEKRGPREYGIFGILNGIQDTSDDGGPLRSQ